MLSRSAVGALGERSDRAVLGAGLRSERVQLRPGAGQRFEEMVRALVAIGGELGEALVDQRQAAVDLGDHALRGAILLGDAARQAFERRRSHGRCSRPAIPRLPRRPCRCRRTLARPSAATAAACASMPERISSSVAEVRLSSRSSAPEKPLRLRRRVRGRACRRFDFRQARGEPRRPLRRSIRSVSRVRSARAVTCSPKLRRVFVADSLPTDRSCSATARAVCSARGRSSSRTAMSLRADSAARSSASPWSFKPFAAGIELASDPAELARWPRRRAASDAARSSSARSGCRGFAATALRAAPRASAPRCASRRPNG